MYNNGMLNDTQPFKHGILDTLESQSLPLANNLFLSNKSKQDSKNMPNFGSLLQPPNNAQRLHKEYVDPQSSSIQPYDRSAMNVSKDIRPDKLKVILNCFDEKELIKDVPL